MKVTISLIAFFLALTSVHAEENNVTIKVKRGDMILRILEKYQLAEASCNVDAFYAINKMKKGEHILAGFSYKLPISIYDYNGQSIRSTIGLEDWDLAVQIQEYNKKLQQDGIKKTYFIEDKKLYVPYHLLGCSDLGLKNSPAKVTTKKEAAKEIAIKTDIFFGENHKVIKKSNALANDVYYIISGHGGPDPGAMKTLNNNHLCEDEYAYDVSLRLAKKLLENGATVHMIIQDKNDGIRDSSYLGLDKDEICKTKGAIPLNQVARLRQRVQAVNGLYAKERKSKKNHKVIAIHVDSRSKNLKQDVFFYYAPGSKSGKRIANNLQNTFKTKYQVHQKGRGYGGTVSSRNLFVLRKTNPSAVYVELANIQNPYNQKRIMPYTNRQILAEWLYEGLIK